MAASSSIRKFISVVMADARVGGASTPPTERSWTVDGFWVRPDAFGYPSKDAQRAATFAKVLTSSNILGGEVPVCWGRIETSQNVYDWSSTDADIAVITENGTNGKKVIIALTFQRYGNSTIPTTPQSGDIIIPDYIIDAGWCASRSSGGIMPKLDNTSCWNRFKAFINAAIGRYGENPHVEMIIVGETSSYYVGMDTGAYDANWVSLPADMASYASGKTAWPGISHNGIHGDAANKALCDNIVAYGLAHGTEDTIGYYGSPSTPPANFEGKGFFAIRGGGLITYEGSTYNWGSTDSRLVIPLRPENQVIRSPDLTLAQITQVADNPFKASHFVVVLYFSADGSSYTPGNYFDGSPVPAQSGDNWLAFIQNSANNPARTTYPTFSG